MANKVSMREYARLRGVNLSAVQNAIKSGRIHTEPDGKIDVEEANRDWFINTDQSKQRKPDPIFESQIESPITWEPFNRPKRPIFITGP